MKAFISRTTRRLYDAPMADRTFFWCAAAMFTAVLLASLLIPAFLSGSSANLRVFYGWADLLMKGLAPFLSASEQPAPLARSSLDAWVPVPLMVGICDLASAILLLRMAWKAYGREAGLVAGTLFTATIALPQGSLTAEGALALALLLASSCLLLSRPGLGYLAAGAAMGLATWLAPYTATLLLAGLYMAYRTGGIRMAIWPAAGFILALPIPVLALMPFSTAFPVFAHGAPLVSMAASGTPDTLISVAGLSVSLAVLTSLLPAALLGLAGRRIAIADAYFLFSGLAFVSTLFMKQYLSYWIFALPFIVLLCAAQWAKPPET